MSKKNNEYLANIVLGALHDYRQKSERGDTHVLRQKEGDVLAREMGLSKWIRKGGLSADNINEFLGPYLEHSQHMHHPGYIGHQVAVPHEGGAIADMIHGVINNPMAVYEMGPTAAVTERTVVNWMLEKVGWFSGALDDFSPRPNDGAGFLTHGGSVANLTCVLSARAKIAPKAWQDGTPQDLAIIAPKVSHYSMARAVSIVGLGQRALVPAPVTDIGVLRAEDLEQTYRRATENGQRIFMVSANACSTATGLYDPINEIADFCEAHDLWLHIDGAHGASALISGAQKHLLKGVARADSLIWDAHKMLRTSALCAGVLFKDPKNMMNTFAQDQSYLFYGDDQIGFDVGPYALECTKYGLGTKLFMVLAMEGEKGLGAFVDKQYKDTKAFHELIKAQDDFECPYVPESNILCFRYTPIDDNAQQLALREKLLERGNFYITTAELSGVRYLRLSVMNPLTNLETIKKLLDEIRACAN